MKKLLATSAILMVLLLSVQAFANLMPSTTALQMHMINQDPDPVRPGEYVDLKFRVINNGQQNAHNVKVEIVEGFPFSLDPGVSATKDIGTIGVLQRDAQGVVIDYKVRVASDAVLGRNKITIKYWYDGSSVVSQEFIVDVRERDSGISIVGVSTTPTMLIPGNDGRINIQLQNPSDLPLRDVTVQIGLNSDAIPIAPFQSATTKKIPLLRQNEISTFSFGVIPFSDAAAGVYRIPVTISYFGSENAVVETHDIIGILIGTEPDVSINLDTSGYFAENRQGRVVVYFVNKGLSDVRFLNLAIRETDAYDVVSSNEAYIGLVSSDDFETADFTLFRKTKDTSFTVQLVAQYRDANNNLYEEELTIPVVLYSSSLNGRKGFGALFWIVVLIAAGGGYWYYRKNKKRR
jgi:hypothetical protein